MADTNIPLANECLWKNKAAVGKIAAFDLLQTAALTTKVYNNPYAPAQRNNSELSRIGYNTDPAKDLTWLYEAEVNHLILVTLGKTSPNGLATLNNSELDQIASAVAAISGEIIITDHEGSDAWIWPSFEQPQKISYISQKVKELTQSGSFYKKYLDWFQRQNFTFNGKTLGMMTNNGVWENGGVSLNDYLDFYANPSGASNFDDNSTIGKCGWGYTSITYKPENFGGNVLPANVNFGAISSYLFSLCGLNRKMARDSSQKILYIIWAREDQERLNYQQVRYQPKALNGSTNPTGWLRMVDNRLSYPSNLVADNAFWAACHPNVVYIHSWVKPNSEDPQDILRYAKRNWADACQSNVLGFTTANYEGSDNPPCPSSGLDYYGDEALGFNATMRGLNRFALHQDILDGTQTGSCPAFEFKRDGDADWTSVGAVTDGSEFARAGKFKRPVLKVWTKPSNSKKFVMFQDCFAEAFEPVQYRATIGGTLYTKTAEGNNTHAFRID